MNLIELKNDSLFPYRLGVCSLKYVKSYALPKCNTDTTFMFPYLVFRTFFILITEIKKRANTTTIFKSENCFLSR